MIYYSLGNTSKCTTPKYTWFVQKVSGLKLLLKRVEAKQRSCYWRFLILRVSYTTTTLPTGKQVTRNSTWRSCDDCVNQFVENDRKIGVMATESCTTTMLSHTIHNFCGSFWPNTAPLSCISRHTHQISHRVTFSYSQGLRKF